MPLLVQRDLPPPLFNVPVEIADGRIEVDFLCRDRWPDRELMRAGYACLRVTSLQAEQEAEATADTVAARLTAPLPKAGEVPP